MNTGQLISYIAPASPATRRPATGTEPPLRVEAGFTPNWYRKKLDIDFGEKWHNDPAYRKETVIAMRKELKRRFAGFSIGVMSDEPDLLTGTYGANMISAIYGVPVVFSSDNWPSSARFELDDHEMKILEPPGLDSNPFFQNFLEQIEWIRKDQGKVAGFINWQGVLNNAHRLRGQQIFTDMYEKPELLMHLMGCVCTTMIEAARQLQQRQMAGDFEYHFFTVSNCLVNMISPEHYRDFVLPFDKKISSSFNSIGIHNCAWNADPYMEYYAGIPGIGYIDMGIDSDLAKARNLFPDARRAIMYTPMDLNTKSLTRIREDLARIAVSFSPCDIVLADIDVGVADEKVIKFLEIAQELNSELIPGKLLKGSG
jgi:hypothetical protein